jgi:hypothetical protein
MKVVRAGALEGQSTAMRRYLDRQISSKEYFREVRKETARQVDRELKENPKGTER